MTFTSLSYFLFLPLVYLTYHFTADRYRWLVLLVASYGFFATFKAPQLLLALVLVTVISHACGIRMGETVDPARRKRIFRAGTASCVLILGLFKILPVLPFSVRIAIPDQNLLLTVGVSYFTFQAISYLADVYLELLEPEEHLGYHALALAFFPKLLQGPIERAGDLLPQLKKSYQFDYDAMRSGALLFTWGLFKKVVVADRLAQFVDPVYANAHAYTGLPLLLATYVYALQIYFDFAGYTDMARGTARMFGVNLTENFNSPYLATSIADFWRRWHMSFSRWILDYIFKPLQMAWRDHGQAGAALALIITFLVSGIWHGARGTFIVWGLVHGIYLAASTYYRPYQKKLHHRLGLQNSRWLKGVQIGITFNLVCLAWVFFRANGLGQAWYVLRSGLDVVGTCGALQKQGMIPYIKSNIMMGNSVPEAVLAIVSLAIILTVHRSGVDIVKCTTFYRWSTYSALVFSIVFFGSYRGGTFVYVQF